MGLRVGAAHSGLRSVTGALPGGYGKRTRYLLTTRLEFEMTDGCEKFFAMDRERAEEALQLERKSREANERPQQAPLPGPEPQRSLLTPEASGSAAGWANYH